MKLLILLWATALMSAGAAADTSNISFDGLGNTTSFIEDGFRFDGILNLDNNFSASPSLRIYGNVPLTISRVDGAAFSLDSLYVLYRYDDATPWWVSNDRGQGFQLTRTGEFLAGQFPTFTMVDVTSLRIFDPYSMGTNYYVLDDFQLSYVAPVSEPNLSFMLLSGVGLLIAYQCKKRRAII